VKSREPAPDTLATPNGPVLSPPTGRGFWLAWAGFCALMLLVGMQEVLFDGYTHWQWPLFDELVALAVATGVAAWRWRVGPRDDLLLATPLRWFARALSALWWVAPGFVLLMYGIRHAARALLGDSYLHAPWQVVLGYEGLKFSVFYLLLSGVQFGLRSHQALAAERLRAAQFEQLSVQARLQQLTQQVQPHFLFNALNTIAGLLHDNPRAADAVLVRLAALMRAATDAAAAPEHRWSQELALARSYGELMVQRFGSRVQLNWHDDPAAADCRVPALSVQPLLENAFVHGVEQRAGPVHIEVAVSLQAGRLRVTVKDDAGQLPPTLVEGVGLANLRQRLQALHGDSAVLALEAVPGGGVLARLELPA